MTELMSIGSRQSEFLPKGQSLCLSDVYISSANVVLVFATCLLIMLDLT
jgi:hypothetical protein